jgi:hypothetical protein
VKGKITHDEKYTEHIAGVGSTVVIRSAAHTHLLENSHGHDCSYPPSSSTLINQIPKDFVAE